jgi:ribokinase
VPAPPRVGVVGSCNVDLVVRVATLPRPGETVLGGDVERLPGGKGANQATAAARLGADAVLLGAVGADEDGDWLVEGLAERGVDVSKVARVPRPTGVALIAVAPSGENQIVVAPGANLELDLSAVDLGAYDVVLASAEVAAAALAAAAGSGARLVLNASPAAGVAPEVLSACEVVVVNEVEAAAVDAGALRHCVVTRGAAGAVLLDRGYEVARAPAPRVAAVDTVGAGDVFCAAYAVRLAGGDTPAAALAFAATAGALATLAAGAQGSQPTTEEVERWLA